MVTVVAPVAAGKDTVAAVDMLGGGGCGSGGGGGGGVPCLKVRAQQLSDSVPLLSDAPPPQSGAPPRWQQAR